MNRSLALAAVACLLVGILSVQTIKCQSTSETPAATDSPATTPIPQQTPISPWLLMLVVFASVSLTAVVVSGVQKFRARGSN